MEDPQGINEKSVSKQLVSPEDKKVMVFKVVIIFLETKWLENLRKLHVLLVI